MVCAVILTALSVEYLAVRTHLTDLHEETNPQGTVYERGRFVASIQEWDVGIAEVGVGNTVAATESERAIAYFNPDILLFVGIAGGIKDVAIGDVVAATKIYGYESGKVDEQFLIRPALGQSTYLLVHRARADAKKDEWLKRIYNKPASTPKVFVAPIAAGEKVIASKKSDVLQFLKTSYNDAIAIEMEGFGFLNAAFAHSKIQTIMIRGISDLIDGKSDSSVESEQARQKKASDHASAFAFEILSQINRDTSEILRDSISPISPTVMDPIIDFDAQSIGEIRNNYHNLPCRLYTELIGREEYLKDLLYRISPEFCERTITIIGIGGVGKTSLALAAAYACLEASISGGDPSIPTFDLIIFSSAQLNTLLPKGIVNLNEIYRPIRTLQDLCVDISNTLNQSGLKLIDPANLYCSSRISR
jgi:nucleoside phosphorylase